MKSRFYVHSKPFFSWEWWHFVLIYAPYLLKLQISKHYTGPIKLVLYEVCVFENIPRKQSIHKELSNYPLSICLKLNQAHHALQQFE